MGMSRRDRIGYWLERHIRPNTLLGCLLYTSDGQSPVTGNPMFTNRVNRHMVVI